MVKDIKYIIKRIIIGVGIAICLMYLKGGLIGNVSAKVINISAYGDNYRLIKSQNTSSHNVPNLWCQTDGNQFCNNVVALRVEDDNSLATDNKYKIENTLQIVVKNNTIPSFRDTTVSVGSTNQTPLTFNYNGRNGYETGSCGSLYSNSVPGTCTKLNWGTQVSFTSTSTGHSIIWYYLNSSYSLGLAEITSHSITNTGNTFADSTSNIINNNNNNTNQIINNQNNNTNQINQNINNNLNSKCSNLLNKNSYYYDSSSRHALYFDLSNLVIGKQYTISTNKPVYIYKFSQGTINDGSSTSGPEVWTENGINSWTFIYNGNNRLFMNIVGKNVNFVNNINDLSSYNFMLVEGSSSKSYCEYGSKSNKLDDMNNNLNNINSSLNDTSSPNVNDFLNGFDVDDSNTPVSDLLLMPINLLRKYVQGFTNTCSAYQFGSLLGTNISFPCINIESYVGTGLWTIIDGLFSIFMIYNICMLGVSFFEAFTSLDDSFQVLYTPQHGNLSREGRGHSGGLY